MLERLAAWFLNTYVAEYVGNVVTDQLSIGLLNGAVELEKLPLKKDALKKLKLPVDIKAGYIGKLKLQIPVRYIKSQPWVVQIDQLYIIAGPPKPGDYNAEEEEQQAQTRKQAKLDKLEQEWKAEQQKSSSWWYWITPSFPSNVIANLQVIVNDVHIRYEDSDADPAHPFAMGIMLENVSAQSTNENWEPKFDTDKEKARKLFDLKDFAVYWDREVMGDLEGQDLVDAMLKKHGSVVSQQQPLTASTIFDLQPSVQYIIKPVSGQAKLTRDCSKTPLRIRDGPRFHLEVQLAEIPVILSDRQYQALMSLFDAFNVRLRAQRYRKWRPVVALKERPQAWWQFAITCVLERIRHRNRRSSKNFALRRAQQNVTYVTSYMQHLTQATLSQAVQQELQAIEAEQNFEELAVLRKIAMTRIKRERDLAEAAKKRIESESSQPSQGILQRWLPGWYQSPTTPPGGGSGDDETSKGRSESTASDLEVEDELLDELGYEAESDILFLRDRILLTLSFSLGQGSFQLVTTPSSPTSFLGPKPLVELGFSSLCCAADIRPKLHYASYDLSLGSLTVHDHSDQDSLFAVLVQPKGAEVVGTMGQLFRRQYTVFDPLDSFVDGSTLFSLKVVQEEIKRQKHFRVRVHTKPLDIVYNPSTIAEVKEFFTTPVTSRNTVQQLRHELQTHTTAELKNRLEGVLEGENKASDHRISVKLDVSAPHIIIPENFKDKETSMVILDLGHLTFGNISDWSAEEKGLGVEGQIEEFNEDDDDEFATPPSSPPSEDDTPDGTPLSQPVPAAEVKSAIQSLSSLMELQNDPYERYLLCLSDLQVLVGKADESWREAVKSGHSQLHLLDKFTLSVRIQRMLHFNSETPEPNLSLAANLPSLNFHVDEQKVHALIACLRPIKMSPSTQVPDISPEMHLELAQDFTTSVYQSAYAPESFDNIRASMYHSMGDFFSDSSTAAVTADDQQDSSVRMADIKALQKSLDPAIAKERHQRRLLVATEKLISAQLSIDEVNLSLSSRGRIVTELSVPGVKLEALKRPYDAAVRLLIQDLCLADRIQTFGPEYELVVCSSGKTLLSGSSFEKSPTILDASFNRRFSCPDFGFLEGEVAESKNASGKESKTDHDSTSSKLKGSLSADLLTTEEDSVALLALNYRHISPYSPEHPATRDLEEDEFVIPEGEASIQRINVQCTAVDVIANQETVVELISFFQRALPIDLFRNERDESKPKLAEEMQQKVKKHIQTEMKVEFERLGVRMLRRVHRKKVKSVQEKQVTSQFIASFMFYGLTVEGSISTDTSLQGRLQGVRISDLTPAGKKYPEIVTIGFQNGISSVNTEASIPDKRKASTKEHLQCLGFSIHRSPRPSTALGPSQAHDTHFSAFVPSIYYTHSVNFIYEMEMFVSEFQLYSVLLTNSFKSAAIGVAKGLVSEKSQIAERLGKLSTTFGPTNTRASFQASSIKEQLETEAIDGGIGMQSGDRLYLDVSVQSPVIVLPSSLRSDECLIAHLGEISLQNEFLQQGDLSTTEDAMLSSSHILGTHEIDRVVLKITNVSLHAAHDKASREWLVSQHADDDSFVGGKYFKVLKESSLMMQIDRSMVPGAPNPLDDARGSNLGESFGESPRLNADVTVTGKVCEPLLIRLPKEVFDQIQTTLKHGLRRRVSPRSKPHPSEGLSDSGKQEESASTGASVSGSFAKSAKLSEQTPHSLPSICASFSVPKLSLELKHTIDNKERNLVYVVFEDFSVQFNKSDPHVASVDLALKSIVIEDLLQPEDSEYRYLLASSANPLPFISPVATPTVSLHKLSHAQSLGPSIAKRLLHVSKLMSTPRVHQSTTSPLRCFSPYEEESRTSELFSEDKQTDSNTEDAGITVQEPTMTNVQDLVTINAQFVDEQCPEFASKYNSVCGHATVDFSSVYVIINLQTWVLLFDYLGIGIPTPPSSRPSTPTTEDSYYPESFRLPGEFQLNPPAAGRPQSGFAATHPSKGDASLRHPLSSSVLIGRTLTEDARDFYSLGSDEGSIYMSTWQKPPDSLTESENEAGVGKLSAAQESLESQFSEGGEEVGMKSTVWGVEGKMGWDIVLHVRSLTVTFNKPEHPLARGTANSLNARVGLERGNLKLSGSLGQGSVVDLTETGAFYRERFTTTGDQALTFEIFKYGRPDPQMERPYDISAKVQLASVRYLHTMRFLKEILAFCTHFPQLIDAFQRMKAMAQGNLVYLGPERKPRILLDVNAAGPVLLIPKHAFSPELMVGDIGHVRVTNKTLYDGEEGTITYMRKQQDLEHSSMKRHGSSLPETSIRTQAKLSPQASVQSQLSLISVDDTSSVRSSVTSSQRSGWEASFPNVRSHPWGVTPTQYPLSEMGVGDNSIFGSFHTSMYLSVEEDRKRVESQLEACRGPCLLDCIELDLTEVDVFSARKVKLEGNNFKIVRQPGILLKEKGAAKIYIERNLHEDFCRDVPDFHIEGTLSAIHVMLDKSQLELIKGLIDMNLGEGIEEFEKPSTVIRDPILQPVAADVWTGFLFRMQFVNVKLEFLQSRENTTPGSLTRSLALFDIQQSEFSFESRSNQSKTVDFTSHAVIGYDTRFEDYDDDAKPSVFSEVLRPRFSSQQTMKKSIQVEIHVMISPTQIKASILLNKLRLMGIFDLLLALKCFVIDKIPEEVEEDSDEVDTPLVPSDSLRRCLTSQLSQSPAFQVKKPDRDIRLNLSVTETDFVVAEDITSLDSNAVVLKGTLVLQFRSRPNKEKTVNCSIDGLELFSCSLSNEDETALSILDPVSVTVEVKPPDSRGRRPAINPRHTLLDAVCTQTLEIEIQQLNFRLSYNDLKMFLAIAQTLPTFSSPEQKRESNLHPREGEIDEALVKRLLPLGFTRSSIRKELYLSDGNLNEAALKLLEQQDHEQRQHSEQQLATLGGGGEEEVDREEREGKEGEKAEKTFTIGNVEVVVEYLSVCLIDDCVNRDVPLLDFTLTELHAEHDLLLEKKGKATSVFSGEYYNRNISSWEPMVEPWRFQLAWQKVTKYSTDLDSNVKSDRMHLSLSSPEQLCVNITSSLIHILKTTQASWRQDLQSDQIGSSSSAKEQILKLQTHHRTLSGGGKAVPEEEGSEPSKVISNMEKGLALLHSVRFVSQTRQRMRFVPFLLRNSTGLPLRFATLTSVPSKVYVSPSALYARTRGSGRVGGVVSNLERTSEWMDVAPGKERPFDFTTRSKLRHRDTRAVIVHQLLVKVAGWERIDIPVSVDKIGVFFREVWPSSNSDLDSVPELTHSRGPVRLVFAISLSDTQKVVNVRSALVLHNTMELPLEVKLEDPEISEEGAVETTKNAASINLPPLPPCGYTAIPLHLTLWSIKVRPQGWGVQFCSKHLAWKHVAGKLPTSHTRACEAFGEGEEPPFRFCVSVKRENYPPDVSPSHPSPAHTLTLNPPLTVANLLPCDIQFLLTHNGLRKLIRKGKEISIYSVDSMKPIDFMIAIESFISCQGCTVSQQHVGMVQSMTMEDAEGRPLRLTVTSEVLGGTALKVSISCAYWLINRTGLPVVFKQDGMGREAAGQSEEHERASTTTPLLFSYSQGEFVEKCTVRLGRGYRYLRGGQPCWCLSFRMISESGVIRAFVRSMDGRPDQEYQIGVDIRRGHRQYLNTRVVTFVARYQFENRTQYKLAYLQRHQLQDEEGLSRAKKIPTIMPSAVMAFHWPRTDLDQLLTIRVDDIPDCQWSGGFTLDKDYSFHINMRGSFGHSIFVRCEVILRGATYHVVFSDAAHYPPPFRLENLSQMPVTYFQSGVSKPILLTLLNPGQSVPYAWDEPTYPERLSLQVKGSREIKEYDMNAFGPKDKLYYESYFYITAVATFPKESSSAVFHGAPGGRYRGNCAELVLDVPQGTAVIFQKKDPERRSQLWRMTPTRQLVHIASSSSKGDNMVLDIAGRLPARGQFVPLVIRQMSSSSRVDTQTWKFSEGGRLFLANSQNLCVQSRPGYESLREGADTVLGHVISRHQGIPPEQRIKRLKHSPGSGVLSVRVVSSGPTRILRITDENKKYTHTSPRDDWVVVDHGLVAPSKSTDIDRQDSSWETEEEADTPTMEVELSLVLERGLGISIINSVPEELLFATLQGIRVEFLSSAVHHCLNATIQHIQADNQLATSYTPLLAYPTPPPTGEPAYSYPVLRVFAEKVPHKSPFALVFKVLEVKLQEMTLLLEEKLLFKLLQWAGVGVVSQEGAGKEDQLMNMLTQSAVVHSSSDEVARQLYFESLKIQDTELRVSMHTTSQLPDDLQRIKRHLGFPLVKFESPIYLDGFHQAHMLGTTTLYADALVKHYKKVVKGQAIKILGSVDFLGNPVGLLSDVASGVSGMIAIQPDVVGLVRDVAHGTLDTTSKVTGTLSYMLGQATFDSSFQEEREQILEGCQSSGDHFKAGLIGLTSGVFGGVTSLITQPYKGAQEYGIGGFFTGVGKGLLGTVAKPVAGIFDFASGTTAALREGASRVSRSHPPPVRHRRCCVGPSGALTCYSISLARGQEYLLRLTDGEFSEKLVSYELLNEKPPDRMKVIISSQYLYFFRESPPDPSTIEAKFSLHELAECRAAQGKTAIPTTFIVLSLMEKQKDGAESKYKAPKFRCSDERRAKTIAQLINYAKNLHEEEKHVVRTLRLQHETIW